MGTALHGETDEREADRIRRIVRGFAQISDARERRQATQIDAALTRAAGPDDPADPRLIPDDHQAIHVYVDAT